MAYLKMMNESYFNSNAVENVVHYITGHSLCTGSATTSIVPDECIFQMYTIKAVYGKMSGRQIRHFILAFNSAYECITMEELQQLGAQIASYYDKTYQVIWAIHISKNNHWHLHFAMNTVSYMDGRMYREGYGDLINLGTFISAILPDGVEPLKFGYGKSYEAEIDF